MAALSGEDPRAPPGSIKLFGQPTSRTPRRAGAARSGLHFVPEERLGRGAVPTLSLAQNTLLTRTETVGRGGWIRTGAGARAGRADLIAPLQRQGRRPGRGGQEPVGRQPAEVHRRPRDRRQPEAADRLAADLGRRRRRGGADPRRAADAARRRLRAAGGQRGARRAVRDLRPAGRDRAGPAVAAACRPREATIEQIGEWMAGLWDQAPRRRRGGGGPCSSLKPGPQPSKADVARLAAAGAGDHGGDRRRCCSCCSARTRCAACRCSSSSR